MTRLNMLLVVSVLLHTFVAAYLEHCIRLKCGNEDCSVTQSTGRIRKGSPFTSNLGEAEYHDNDEVQIYGKFVDSNCGMYLVSINNTRGLVQRNFIHNETHKIAENNLKVIKYDTRLLVDANDTNTDVHIAEDSKVQKLLPATPDVDSMSDNVIKNESTNSQPYKTSEGSVIGNRELNTQDQITLTHSMPQTNAAWPATSTATPLSPEISSENSDTGATSVVDNEMKFENPDTTINNTEYNIEAAELDLNSSAKISSNSLLVSPTKTNDQNSESHTKFALSLDIENVTLKDNNQQEIDIAVVALANYSSSNVSNGFQIETSILTPVNTGIVGSTFENNLLELNVSLSGNDIPNVYPLNQNTDQNIISAELSPTSNIIMNESDITSINPSQPTSTSAIDVHTFSKSFENEVQGSSNTSETQENLLSPTYQVQVTAESSSEVYDAKTESISNYSDTEVIDNLQSVNAQSPDAAKVNTIYYESESIDYGINSDASISKEHKTNELFSNKNNIPKNDDSKIDGLRAQSHDWHDNTVENNVGIGPSAHASFTKNIVHAVHDVENEQQPVCHGADEIGCGLISSTLSMEGSCHSVPRIDNFLSNISHMILDRQTWSLLMFLICTAASVVCFLLSYIYLEYRQKRVSPLLAKMNQLEQRLVMTVKENDSLKQNASAVDVGNEQIAALEKQINDACIEKTTLQEQVLQLEKELESSTELGMELNRMISDLLSSQTGNEILENRLEQLQSQLSDQQVTINATNVKLAQANEENSDLKCLLDLNQRKITDLQMELDQVLKNVCEMDEQRQEEERTYSERVQQLNQQVSSLTKQLSDSKHETWESREKFRDIERERNKLISKLEELNKDEHIPLDVMEATDLKSDLKSLRQENQTLAEEIKKIELISADWQSQANHYRFEWINHKTKFEQADRARTELQTKLDVLNQYFKEREAELQQEITKHEAKWLEKQGETTSIADRLKFLQDQIENYKQQNETLQKEIVNQEIELKNQISLIEKEAHDNWVISRQAERKLKEAKQEAAQLRQMLTARQKDSAPDEVKASQKNITSMEMNLRMENGGEIPPNDFITLSPSSERNHVSSASGTPGSPTAFLGPPPPFPPPPFMPPPFMVMPPPMPPPALFSVDHPRLPHDRHGRRTSRYSSSDSDSDSYNSDSEDDIDERSATGSRGRTEAKPSHLVTRTESRRQTGPEQMPMNARKHHIQEQHLQRGDTQHHSHHRNIQLQHTAFNDSNQSPRSNDTNSPQPHSLERRSRLGSSGSGNSVEMPVSHAIESRRLVPLVQTQHSQQHHQHPSGVLPVVGKSPVDGMQTPATSDVVSSNQQPTYIYPKSMV